VLVYRNKLNRKYSVKAKCSKHPRYNPEKSGRGGVIEGCKGCEEVHDFWFLTKRLHAILMEMDSAMGRWALRRIETKAAP
jgi:hypothetical protein